MSIFGTGGVVIAGHHVSYGLLAVILSVPVAGLAIYQFRQGGAIGAGSPVSSGTGLPGDTTGGGGGGGSSDAALQNLAQQVSGLADYLRAMPPYSPALPSSPSNTYISNRYTTITKAADVPPPPPTPTPPSIDVRPFLPPWLGGSLPPPPPPPPVTGIPDTFVGMPA